MRHKGGAENAMHATIALIMPRLTLSHSQLVNMWAVWAKTFGPQHPHNAQGPRPGINHRTLFSNFLDRDGALDVLEGGE
ncbi:hypothetical protein Taro_023870 [Colocasia esculenta]|uniref:Uncharacterized protein n=1 Tax=Colocasia esculenta TaxID=4460 RepID=A0A843VFR3_COLES|nr:hypothetical protein [Colocasia esculenta]